MKNKNVIGILLFVAAVLLIGQLSYRLYTIRTEQGKPLEVYNEKKESGEGKEGKVERIQMSADQISYEGLTLLDEFAIDLDRDGLEEGVRLFTAAQRDSSGEIMWDDGQNWKLVVEDEKGVFVLFDGYVQLGSIDFWLYTSGDEGDYHITTLQPGSASLLMNDFIYKADKMEFEKREVFNPPNVNMLHMYNIE